jgi:glycerol-3-phosphate dehydrogenase (NAD(P)+)
MMSDTVVMVGGGSWATALVKILTENGHRVSWWMRDPDNIAFIRTHRHNGKYLRGATLDISLIDFHTSLGSALQASDLAIFAVPAAFLASALTQAPREWFQTGIVVSAIKGIEPQSRQIISDYFRHGFGVSDDRLAAIAGPCHAEEVAQELAAYLTIGATNPVLGSRLAALLRRSYIHTQTVADLDGVEFAAVLKNIYAVATGIAAGIGTGDNFRAVLVSAAAREMRSFLDAIVPGSRDILHSVYIGDLLVTCYSQFSRNRTFGNMIGHGYSVRSAQLEMNMVAEGYYASACVWQLARDKGIELPLADAVYRILYEQVAPRIEFRLLMEKLL